MNQSNRDDQIKRALDDAAGHPPAEAVRHSRQGVEAWFAASAPVIHWGSLDTPAGVLYVASNARGVSRTALGGSVDDFLARLDPLARLVQGGGAAADALSQVALYFSGARSEFDVPLDMDQMTPFQALVLRTALDIPAGTVWTYGQLARSIGRPKASRAVGTALGSNPIPLIIPCHRVIGTDGTLHGYGTGEGIPTKRWLLTFEGAL